MHDALLVRRGQAVGDLRGDVEGLARQRPVREQLAQVAPFDELHRDVGDAVAAVPIS